MPIIIGKCEAVDLMIFIALNENLEVIWSCIDFWEILHQVHACKCSQLVELETCQLSLIRLQCPVFSFSLPLFISISLSYSFSF